MDDVELVGRFFDVEDRYRQAMQRVLKVADRLERIRQPVQRLDEQSREAYDRRAAAEGAQTAAGEWREAYEQQRDIVGSASADRAAARGRGPAARRAGERLANSTYDGRVHAEKVNALAVAAREAADRVGTSKPEEWERIREEATATLEAYPAAREAAQADVEREWPAAQAELRAASDAGRAVLAEREAVRAQLAERRLDADRLEEAASRLAAGRELGQPGDGRTEAALAAWQERQRYTRRAAELDAEREARSAPEPRGAELDR